MGSVTDDKYGLEAPTIAGLTLRFRSQSLAAGENLASLALQLFRSWQGNDPELLGEVLWQGRQISGQLGQRTTL